jgi:hypothetical protein
LKSPVIAAVAGQATCGVRQLAAAVLAARRAECLTKNSGSKLPHSTGTGANFELHHYLRWHSNAWMPCSFLAANGGMMPQAVSAEGGTGRVEWHLRMS